MSTNSLNANDSKAEQWLSKLCGFLTEQGIESVDDSIANHTSEVNRRKAGKRYTLSAHIRAMVYAMLSNQREWKWIQNHIEEIDRIFSNFNPSVLEKLTESSSKGIVDNLKAIRCGNRRIGFQIPAIPKNIGVFRKIEEVFGSIDKFIASADNTWSIAKKFSSKSSDFKLREMGVPLVCEYLKGVGINCMKPDVHLRRFLSDKRMGTVKAKNNGLISEKEAFEQVEALSKETGRSAIEIDAIIWRFCADGYGEVCGATPKCDNCPIKSYCNYTRKHP